MINNLRVLSEGLRIFYRSVYSNVFGWEKQGDSLESISRNILLSCYDSKKKYFRTSSGHFCQFYARDFGMCCASLIKLGFRNEVKNTLVYAMDIYIKNKKITTHITPSGKIVDFPSNTPESAAYMLRSLLLLNDKELIKKYRFFFNELAEEFYEKYVDKETGLLRKDMFFSSMKDHSLRVSDCYNNCMLGMFVNDLKRIGIKCSLNRFNYKDLIYKYFWNGSYFLEDLSGKDVVSGDANTFPFWTGLFDEEDIFKSCLKAIRSKKLDRPFPLKYTADEDVSDKMHFADLFVPGYERDTIWPHLGLCYMTVVRNYDLALLSKYVNLYSKEILKHGTFLEVYFSDGSPFRRPLYCCDQSMLWVAIFIDLKRSL